MADDRTAEIDKPNMTPMIDVVFQLIVFFIVTMKFKSLDMKIEAFLPKDRGLAKTTQKPPDVPKLVAVLHRKKGEVSTRVKLGNQTIGDLSPDNYLSTMKILTEAASGARQRAGDAANEVKGEVDAGWLVPTGDVLRAVDAFIAGGLIDVTFVGTPPPDSSLNPANQPGR